MRKINNFIKQNTGLFKQIGFRHFKATWQPFYHRSRGVKIHLFFCLYAWFDFWQKIPSFLTLTVSGTNQNQKTDLAVNWRGQFPGNSHFACFFSLFNIYILWRFSTILRFWFLKQSSTQVHSWYFYKNNKIKWMSIPYFW